ncbi:serine/threonine-protein kinase [Saccharomonospora sp. NPDC046836]|uniref:serine/threonine-protein kinase n=1 Tax=Saccharomonospora sp. NPDC046836 TaxID=3156921 RepID=UPI0033D0B863
MKPLQPGDWAQAGRYRPLATLGEGGMGRVLLAAAPDGRLAAVKQIHPGFAHDPAFRQRFAHEVAASRRVSGAYTAAVMDADPHAESPWLASVYVAGPSLREAVDATGPLPVPALRFLAAGLAVALGDIHRAGLIHRDLKPSNVLLAADGPRVIDFGIARAAEGSDLTGTGAVIGSPAFMSPEQAASALLTPASDVFSLGAVLLMAATGQGPFTGTTAAQTLYNVVHVEPDLSAVPPEIRAIAEPCLAKNPAARPSPQQLLDLIGPITPTPQPWPPTVHQLITAQEAQVRTALAWPVPPPAPSPPRRRRWARIAAGVSAVAVVATAAFIAVNLGTDEPPPPQPPAPRVQELPVAEALSVDRLRRTDPCTVLAGARVPGLGVLTAEDTPLYLNRCTYQTADGEELTMLLGEPVTTGSVRRSGTEVAGQPVLTSNVTGGCEASVQLPGESQLAVTVEDHRASAQACDRVQSGLNSAVERLRAGAGEREVPGNSAISADPCSFVDDATARAILGPVTDVTLLRLHQCEWTAGGTLTLTVEQSFGALPDDGYEPARLGDVDGYVREMGADACSVNWTHRQVDGDRTENIRLLYSGAEGGEVCRRAQDFATAVVEHLAR